MKTAIIKRSIILAGQKTSVSLEDAFWNALKEIACRKDLSLSALVTAIDANGEHANLSSAVRLFVLGSYQHRLDETKALSINRRVECF